MRCRAICMLLISLLLPACSATDGKQTRTIPLAHMRPDQAMLLIEPYLGRDAAVAMRKTENPAALTITAPQPKLDQIEELLRRYDTARTVRLRFQVIEGDGFTTTDPAIADVEAALRELLRFRGYRLVAEALATGSPHSATQHTVVGPGDVTFALLVEIGAVTANPDRMSVELRSVALTANGRNVLSSSVTVPNGQTVVLGSARPLPNMGAVILVVRPEIQ